MKEDGDLDPYHVTIPAMGLLKIQHAKKEDSGYYVCEAMNEEGTSTRRIRVDVQGKGYLVHILD